MVNVNSAGRVTMVRRSGQADLSYTIRSVSMSIDGIETERRFFYNCRRATEGGVALHVCNVSSFWSRLAPQLSHHDEAVKHALVALGAAHQLFRLTSHERSDPVIGAGSFLADRLDVFVVHQYNKAIAILCRRLAEQTDQNTTLTLVCCLAFICLESLRSNYCAAIAHLQNGLRVIESSVDVARVSNGSSGTNFRGGGVADTDLRDIVIQFRNIELCIHCFSSEIPMTLGSKFYRLPRCRYSEIAAPRAFTSLKQCHEARIELASVIMSCDWELRHRKGHAQFWSSTEVQEELTYLRQRGLAVDKSIKAFVAGPYAPARGTWDYYSYCMDMLHVTCVRAVVELMPFPGDQHSLISQTPRFQDDFITRMADYGAAMHGVHTSRACEPSSDFLLETAIIGPMYWTYVYAMVPRVRETVLKILQETKHREGPWDASTTLKLLKTKLPQDLGNRETSAEGGAPSLRKWGGESDCYKPLSG
ncbi:hypothetical protein S40293_10045 [Stachybotrys chartarum IBT 40293]|nr:hypothetical protein S40293_10045 [Stachybotrys chartarum IBT 40293]